MSTVKTRFAPSPTGYLHLGSARTALYNWLFARQNKGIFALRIEDTDTARSTKESADQILDSMKYLGLDYDEGPIIQSERLEIYQNYAKQLLEKNFAYEKEGAIFFKAHQEDIHFKDLIIGDMKIPASEQADFVIQKSNGWPVYHFSVVIDDALMGITHVIRGMDHLSNTAKHVQLFKALGFSIPIFAHIPMILGPDKQRLSKRHGAQAVDSYEKEGIIAPAMLNFLARLGWGYQDQEVFTIPELLEKFNLLQVSKNPAVFDPQKLIWINSQHLRTMPILDLQKTLSLYFKKDYATYAKELDLVRARAHTLLDLETQLNTLLYTPTTFEEKGMQKHVSNPQEVIKNLSLFVTNLKTVDQFQDSTLEDCLRSTAETLQIKAGELIHPTRLALTGVTVGPGIFELMIILGKETVLERLNHFISVIK